MKRCCFAGHSKIEIEHNAVKDMIKDRANTLIAECDVKEFWVGNYGDFDHIAATAVRELKEEYSDIRLVLLIPYMTRAISQSIEQYKKDYDEIKIADEPKNTHKKYYIIKANQFMVNNSDYLVCFVQTEKGGAAMTLKYAEGKKDIQIFNLA